jgi:diguanylate cyclase (GGDEF)-like protein
MPLLRGTELIGVIQLEVDKANNIDRSQIEAIGDRAAPLIVSSIAFEQSRANALTDATTDLPNERAFYLMLENQIAAVDRRQDHGHLAVLSIDIKKFADINESFGHAAGDRALNLAAQVIKDHLRQMDFLARAADDEFIVILPKATTEISQDIIERITKGCLDHQFPVFEDKLLNLELNFGWASLGDDGETPQHLLGTARLRRSQIKSTAQDKVLWFKP